MDDGADVGLGDGLLRCKAPAFAVLTHGANGQFDAKSLLDQLQHGGTTSQRKLQLELLGATFADLALHLKRPLRSQATLAAHAATLRFGCQRLEPIGCGRLDR